MLEEQRRFRIQPLAEISAALSAWRRQVSREMT
jgi:hypothetical protein